MRIEPKSILKSIFSSSILNIKGKANNNVSKGVQRIESNYKEVKKEYLDGKIAALEQKEFSQTIHIGNEEEGKGTSIDIEV